MTVIMTKVRKDNKLLYDLEESVKKTYITIDEDIEILKKTDIVGADLEEKINIESAARRINSFIENINKFNKKFSLYSAKMRRYCSSYKKKVTEMEFDFETKLRGAIWNSSVLKYNLIHFANENEAISEKYGSILGTNK